MSVAFLAGIFILLILWVLVVFWYITVPVITLIVISLWWWCKPEISCPGCNKKYRRKGGLNKHQERCAAYQNYIRECHRKHEEAKQEHKRQEEQWRREEQGRKQKQEQKNKRHQENNKKWNEGWYKERHHQMSEDEFEDLQNDIDERKEKATQRYWDAWYETTNEREADRLMDKIDEIEEQFLEEEEALWDQYMNWDDRWNDAYEDWRKTWDKTGDNPFEENEINIEECYQRLGLAVTATWKQVKNRFRELVLKFHPDKVKEKDKKTAEEEFKKIYEAYETIKTKTGGAA